MVVSAGAHGGRWLCAGAVLSGCSVGGGTLRPHGTPVSCMESSVTAPLGTVGSASDSGIRFQSCVVTDQSKATAWGGLNL